MMIVFMLYGYVLRVFVRTLLYVFLWCIPRLDLHITWLYVLMHVARNVIEICYSYIELLLTYHDPCKCKLLLLSILKTKLCFVIYSLCMEEFVDGTTSVWTVMKNSSMVPLNIYINSTSMIFYNFYSDFAQTSNSENQNFYLTNPS